MTSITSQGLLANPMPSIGDREGDHVPEFLPPVVDAHVQCFDVTGKDMRTVYETCVEFDKPLLMHAGREPKSPKYACDPHQLCGADKVEQVLSD